MIRRIALTTDFSAEGDKAFRTALALAVFYRARLEVLHVSRPDRETAWERFPKVRDTLTAWGRRGSALSTVDADLPSRHTASGRLTEIEPARSQHLLARIADDEATLSALLAPDAGPVRSIDRSDGLRVVFANGGIVHLRPSGNAPELRCYAEADTILEAERMCGQCLDWAGARFPETAHCATDRIDGGRAWTGRMGWNRV